MEYKTTTTYNNTNNLLWRNFLLGKSYLAMMAWFSLNGSVDNSTTNDIQTRCKKTE